MGDYSITLFARLHDNIDHEDINLFDDVNYLCKECGEDLKSEKSRSQHLNNELINKLIKILENWKY